MKQGLIRSSTIYFGTNILNASIPLLVLPILTRVLTPADYGLIGMFGLVASILSSFTGLNVQSALAVRYFILNPQRLSEYVFVCFFVILISTLVVLVCIALTGHFLEPITQLTLPWLLLAALMSAAQISVQIRLILWQMQGKPYHYGVMQITQAVMNAGISLYLVVILSKAWEGRLVGQIIPPILLAMVGLASLFKRQQIIIPKSIKPDTVDALKFSLPLIPHSLGAVLLSTIDRIMITNLLDVSQAGIYFIAVQISLAISFITGAFSNAYSPWLMAKLSKPDTLNKRKIVQGNYIYYIALLLLALVIHYSSTWLFMVVGEGFRSASSLIIYLVLGEAFVGMYLTQSVYFLYSNKTIYLSLLTVTLGIFNVGLMYMLIDCNGLMGAAQAFMISMMLRFFAAWYLANKFLPMPWINAIKQ